MIIQIIHFLKRIRKALKERFKLREEPLIFSIQLKKICDKI